MLQIFKDYWLSRLFKAADIKPQFIVHHVWIAFRKYVYSEDVMWAAIHAAEEAQGEIHRAGPDVQRLITAYKNVRDKQ